MPIHLHTPWATDFCVDPAYVIPSVVEEPPQSRHTAKTTHLAPTVEVDIGRCIDRVCGVSSAVDYLKYFSLATYSIGDIDVHRNQLASASSAIGLILAIVFAAGE
jgi:hypothetical protein